MIAKKKKTARKQRKHYIAIFFNRSSAFFTNWSYVAPIALRSSRSLLGLFSFFFPLVRVLGPWASPIPLVFGSISSISFSSSSLLMRVFVLLVEIFRILKLYSAILFRHSSILLTLLVVSEMVCSLASARFFLSSISFSIFSNLGSKESLIFSAFAMVFLRSSM